MRFEQQASVSEINNECWHLVGLQKRVFSSIKIPVKASCGFSRNLKVHWDLDNIKLFTRVSKKKHDSLWGLLLF